MPEKEPLPFSKSESTETDDTQIKKESPKRPIWKGALGFGMVHIPVSLYSATVDKSPDFHFLHKEDLSPIKYAYICKSEGETVPRSELVKGVEVSPSDWVVLTDEDFKKANMKKTKLIDVTEFVDEEKVDPSLYEKPYYIAPDKGAEKAYALFREGLKESGKVGIARFVLRNQEHVYTIKPEENALVLNQLRFADEVRSTESLQLPEAAPTEKEMSMALALINYLASDEFTIENYRDEYTEDLQEIIEEKAAGKEPKARGAEPIRTNIVDLTKVLEASLKKLQEEKPQSHETSGGGAHAGIIFTI